MIIIAHIHTQFPEKFGIPRQSGLVAEATGTIVTAATGWEGAPRCVRNEISVPAEFDRIILCET